MSMCGTCYEAIAGTGECGECRQWRMYWDSLTPEEKASEHRAMGLYAYEADY